MTTDATRLAIEITNYYVIDRLDEMADTIKDFFPHEEKIPADFDKETFIEKMTSMFRANMIEDLDEAIRCQEEGEEEEEEEK